jgi:hypothetical protein
MEESGLELFQVKSRFLWVSLRRSQPVMCRTSICRMNDELVGSGLDMIQVKSRLLWFRLRRFSDQFAERSYVG